MRRDWIGDGRHADGALEREQVDRRRTSVESRRVRADDVYDDVPNAEPSMVIEYLRIILRRRGLIVALTLLGLLLGIAIHLGTQSVYQARTSVEVQALNSDFMDARSVAPTAVAPSDAILQTQLKLLASESLAERVKEKLQTQAHPEEVMENDTLSRIARRLHIKAGQQISYARLMDETANNVKIKALGISQLIEITCDSWNAAFAAEYCNTLTSEFQRVDLESRGSQAKHISDWLVNQAAEVRRKAEDAQHRLEAAAGGNGLMLQAQTDSIGQDRLRQIQTELVHAQADRMERQAELASAVNGPPDIVTDSASYAESKTRLADLQAQVASLVPPLTEANPRIIHLRAQISEVQANMQRERTVSGAKLQGRYDAAKHREDLLRLSYQNVEGTVSNDMQKSSEIEILRREVQSEQQLYQTLLQRAKEAGFASAMPASTLRIVDEARVPRVPLFPKRLATALVGAVVGAALGVLLAFLFERQSPRLRLPGDVSKLIQLDELGVIPSSSIDASVRERLIAPAQNALAKVTGSCRSDRGGTPSEGWDDNMLIAESYRGTMFSLLLQQPNKTDRVFVVSSPNAGEGKTTVTSNLGIALSKSRLRVVLVDGDLRKSRLHECFQVSNTHGLREVLSEGIASYKDRMHLVCKPTSYANLSLITAGEGDQSVPDLLHSPELGDLFRGLMNEFDVVLIDSPPMLHIADARILAGHARHVILVFRSGVTKLSNAISVRNMLQRDRVWIAGSVLNDFDPSREGRMRYYSGYRDYQQPKSEGRAS